MTCKLAVARISQYSIHYVFLNLTTEVIQTPVIATAKHLDQRTGIILFRIPLALKSVARAMGTICPVIAITVAIDHVGITFVTRNVILSIYYIIRLRLIHLKLTLNVSPRSKMFTINFHLLQLHFLQDIFTSYDAFITT
jgi:hypothetical protein